MASIFSSSQLLLLSPAVLLILLLFSPHPSAADGANQMAGRMTFINLCDYPVWPGILGDKGFTHMKNGGLRLESGDILSFVGLFTGWSGRIWARTHCLGGPEALTCATGDCGPRIQCGGRAGAPPFTVAQIAVDATGKIVTYDVSILEGFNVPMAVMAVSDQGTPCPVAGCEMDLSANGTCPTEQLLFWPSFMAGQRAVGCRRICPSEQSGPCKMLEMVKRRCPNLITFSGDKAPEKMMCQSVRELRVAFCPTKMSAVPLLKQVVSFN